MVSPALIIVLFTNVWQNAGEKNVMAYVKCKKIILSLCSKNTCKMKHSVIF